MVETRRFQAMGQLDSTGTAPPRDGPRQDAPVPDTRGHQPRDIPVDKHPERVFLVRLVKRKTASCINRKTSNYHRDIRERARSARSQETAECVFVRSFVHAVVIPLVTPAAEETNLSTPLVRCEQVDDLRSDLVSRSTR
jgi:hypothetical protein